MISYDPNLEYKLLLCQIEPDIRQIRLDFPQHKKMASKIKNIQTVVFFLSGLIGTISASRTLPQILTEVRGF